MNCPQGQEKAPWGDCRRRRLKGVTAELCEAKKGGTHTQHPPSVCSLCSQPPSPRGRQVLSACFIFFRALFDYSTLFFKQLDLLFTVRTLPFTLILGSPLGELSPQATKGGTHTSKNDRPCGRPSSYTRVLNVKLLYMVGIRK